MPIQMTRETVNKGVYVSDWYPTLKCGEKAKDKEENIKRAFEAAIPDVTEFKNPVVFPADIMQTSSFHVINCIPNEGNQLLSF